MRIVSFCARDSGSHGSTNPRDQKAKNASPGTSAAIGNACATSAATVDLPAPGGPVTRIGSVTASAPTYAGSATPAESSAARIESATWVAANSTIVYSAAPSVT